MKNDMQDKNIEIELIENNIKLIKQKLKSGATTLKNSTISQLMRRNGHLWCFSIDSLF
jgi:hypothetical protein